MNRSKFAVNNNIGVDGIILQKNEIVSDINKFKKNNNYCLKPSYFKAMKNSWPTVICIILFIISIILIFSLNRTELIGSSILGIFKIWLIWSLIDYYFNYSYCHVNSETILHSLQRELDNI